MKPKVYILLDSCLLAGYYAPQTLSDRYPIATERIKILIDSVKNGCSPHIRLITPEICVAETQSVLSKHAHSGWNKKPKRDNQKAIHGKSYNSLRNEMRNDLHGGRHIESIPLQRYHVLAKHLVTAVDHSLHLRTKNQRYPVQALGGMDQIITGVSVWLNRFLGKGRLVVMSTDYRLIKVFEKCQKLDNTKAKKLGILDVAKDIGIEWSSSIYPDSIHLDSVSEKRLRLVLGAWELPTRRRSSKTKERKTFTASDLEELVAIYTSLGIGRDKLPYTDKMTLLTNNFNSSTGHKFSEAEVWTHLLRKLKQGKSK